MTRTNRYVASESTKQRPGFFKVRLRLFCRAVVLDRHVSVPERSEHIVPCWKLSDVTQDLGGHPKPAISGRLKTGHFR